MGIYLKYGSLVKISISIVNWMFVYYDSSRFSVSLKSEAFWVEGTKAGPFGLVILIMHD